MIIAYTTAPNENIATEIAHHLIKTKLASCVNLIPKVKSIYYWQDEIVEESEIILMIKSCKSHQQQLIDSIVKVHPYDIPEVIIVPIEGGFKPYLDWLKNPVNK